MTEHPVVPRRDWLAAREDLLAREKALTRAQDEMAAARRRLPWERVDKDYRFLTTSGRRSLHDLFAARRQLIVYHHMLRPADPDWRVDVAACSAATGAGMAEAWELVLAHDRLVRRDEAGREGPLGAKRARQARRWLRAELEDGLLRLLEEAPGLAERLAEAEEAVEGRRESPPSAARRLIAAFRTSLAD